MRTGGSPTDRPAAVPGQYRRERLGEPECPQHVGLVFTASRVDPAGVIEVAEHVPEHGRVVDEEIHVPGFRHRVAHVSRLGDVEPERHQPPLAFGGEIGQRLGFPCGPVYLARAPLEQRVHQRAPDPAIRARHQRYPSRDLQSCRHRSLRNCD